MDDTNIDPEHSQPETSEPESTAASSPSTEQGVLPFMEGAPDFKREKILVFCPHLVVNAVTDVTADFLIQRGIKGVILDLDNTIVRWQKETLSDEILAWTEGLKAAGLKLALLSNSVLSRRTVRVSEILGCVNIRQARKPNARGYHLAMEAMGSEPKTTVMIGDQMFTDIWGGNRAGVYTILVKPLHPGEFPYTRYVSRPPERYMLRWYRDRGYLP